MEHIDFFKLQAKNLHKDFKTKKPHFDEAIGCVLYEYQPRYFDVDSLVCDYDIDEDDFTLMKAQHLISQMVGFKNWAELVKVPKTELELAKLLFDNQHKISIEDWKMYIIGAEDNNNTTFDSEARLEIFTQVFANVEGHKNPFPDYRLNATKMRKLSGETTKLLQT